MQSKLGCSFIATKSGDVTKIKELAPASKNQLSSSHRQQATSLTSHRHCSLILRKDPLELLGIASLVRVGVE